MVFCMHVYTHWGWAHRQRVSITFLTRKNSKFFLCSRRDSNPRPLDLLSNALSTEPTCHPQLWWRIQIIPTLHNRTKPENGNAKPLNWTYLCNRRLAKVSLEDVDSRFLVWQRNVDELIQAPRTQNGRVNDVGSGTRKSLIIVSHCTLCHKRATTATLVSS